MSTCNLIDIEKLERPSAPFICSSAPDDFKKRLTLSRGELVEKITQELDGRVTQLLVCPTAKIFVQERAKVFGEYFILLKAVSKIVLADTDTMVHQALVQGSIAHYEQRVRTRGPEVFGTDVAEEILFSLATLSRAYRLVGQILSKECPEVELAEDAKNAKLFAASVAWSGIHIDCIFSTLSGEGKALPIDVLQEILAGCRLAVTAYAHARLGFNSRYQAEFASQEQTQWDAEGRYLAAVSTEDVTVAE